MKASLILLNMGQFTRKRERESSILYLSHNPNLYSLEWLNYKWSRVISLIHYSPVLLFHTPWKHLKAFRFSDVSRGHWKATPGCNGLIPLGLTQLQKLLGLDLTNLRILFLLKNICTSWIPLICSILWFLTYSKNS